MRSGPAGYGRRSNLAITAGRPKAIWKFRATPAWRCTITKPRNWLHNREILLALNTNSPAGRGLLTSQASPGGFRSIAFRRQGAAYEQQGTEQSYRLYRVRNFQH